MNEFQALYDEAHAAGHKAATETTPAPMVVGRASSIIAGGIVPGTEEIVSEGPCGFAWINIKPGTSKLARWLKANGLARTDSYYGGVTIWVRGYGQSITRKEAYAHAFAEVLRKNGVARAYAQSRLD